MKGEKAAKGGGLPARGDDKGVGAAKLRETDSSGKGIKVCRGVSDNDVEITDRVTE